MSDPLKNLKNTFADILKDIVSMSADVMRKSNLHLDDVVSLDLLSVDTVANNIRTLLERVNTNLSSFKNNFDTAFDNYKNTVKTEKSEDAVTPKKQINLSLRKNGAAEETDIDLTNSDPEDESEPTKNSEVGETTNSATKEEVVTPVKSRTKDDKTDGSVSDTDSEKTVRDFDVPGSSEPLEDEEGGDDDLCQALEELDKIVNEKISEEQEEIKRGGDSMSFDFDDDDFLTDMVKFEKKKEKDEESYEQVQRDNHELLDLLNKAIGDDDDDVITELDGDEALKVLEDEISLSSLSDSEDSLSKHDSDDDWTPPEKTWNESDSESGGNVSDVESLNDEPEVQLKSFNIDMKDRVDQLDDAEIERLCNIHNINKRKCLKQLKKLKKRRKRIRTLSSSSSSSLSSLSSGSTTTDIQSDRPPTPIPNDIHLADVTALADELADKLEQEDVEISSDSSTEEEEEPKKKKPKVEVKNEDEDDDVQIIKSDDDEEEKKKKKRRNSDIFQLFTSSDDDDEDVIVLNDPLKVEDEDKGKTKIEESDETHVISDSESNSDSDDVTIVDDSFDSSGGRGRRNIRSLLSDNELSELTQRAKNEEDERIMRLEEHSKTLEIIQSQREDFVLDVDVKNGAALIVVDYNLVKILKPHQKEGVQFMWEACYESVQTLKTKPGTGCILAHCMGLGKTLQVITLIHTLFNHKVTNTKHVLIICPLSTVTNWRNEFRKTFRFLNKPSNVQQFFIVKGDINVKIHTLNVWRQTGGVLVMGYETFQILTNDELGPRVSDQEKNQAFQALLNPGPDLVVCDEGHQLKNGKTKKTKAVMKIKTKRRIVLTGTPLQNNLQEYYFMVQFVKPHLLGTHKEYNNRFATPITNGQYHDSNPDDIKLMKKRTHVLTKLLKKTIHRVEAGILASYLPEMKDYTVFVKLTTLQMVLYTSYINMIKTQTTNIDDKTFFHDVMILSFNNLHPYTLQLYYSKPKPKKKRKRTDETTLSDNEVEPVDNVTYIRDDWFKTSFPEDVATNINYSSKLKVVMDMLDQSTQNGEKTLIFAQYLVELDLLEHFFKVSKKWRFNSDYYRMDGDTPVESRDDLCKNFNNDSTVKVFLLTHRVGGLGLNLTGANRVIMIGSNYNPTLDTQSMYRVYRFGQEKKCFVYRLLSLATMEEKIYHRCVVKLHLSGTVVDKLHFARQFRSSDLQEMYNVDFGEYAKERPIPVVPTDNLLALLLQTCIDIYKYYLHNSLLENRPEEELTDEDKKLAWDEFNNIQEQAQHVAAVTDLCNPMMSVPANLTQLGYTFWHSHKRSNPPTLVPNPLNSNTRGFIPNFMASGMRPPTPQNTHRVANPTSHLNPLFHLINNTNFNRNTATPAPKEVLQRLTVAHRLQSLPNTGKERARDIPPEAPSGGLRFPRCSRQELLKMLDTVGGEVGVSKGGDKELVRMLDDKLA